jgi:flagellar basal-body rod protein FlgB
LSFAETPFKLRKDVMLSTAFAPNEPNYHFKGPPEAGTGSANHSAMEMVASLFSSDNYTAVKKMMDVSALRHAAIASNLANVSTPGYKRVDLSKSFEDQLRATIKTRDADKIAEANPRTEVDTRTPSTRADGNNVQIDSELLGLTKNTMNFNVLTDFASGSLKQLRHAITGRPA